MAGSIVTGIVVLVIVGFTVFAAVSLRDKDKNTEKKEESGNSKVKDIVDKVRPNRPVPADAPKIYIRTKPDEPYTEYKMRKSRITIGRKNCDINIDSEIVENRHIIIEKHMTDDAMYYVLQNCSRINPVAYRDKAAKKHVNMNYNETVVLSGKDVFHIGRDIKIGTKTQEIEYVDSDSDRERDKEEGNSASRIMWKYRSSTHQNSERVYNDDDIEGI